MHKGPPFPNVTFAISAAFWVLAASIGSSVLNSTLALYPHETETYAVIIPPTGCNPTEWNKVAAIGSKIMYPASPTTLERSPKKMTNITMRHGLCLRRAPFRIQASIKPECCATPMPNIATITNPSGANPVNLVTTCRNSQRIPSGLSKLCTRISSPVCG